MEIQRHLKLLEENLEDTVMAEEGGNACGASMCVSAALGACAVQAMLYVALLHAPTLLLRLPPPSSLHQDILRRFASVLVASIFSIILCFLLLPIRSSKKMDLPGFLNIYGLHTHHLWQASFFPLLLTAMPYLGPMVESASEKLNEWKDDGLLLTCTRQAFVKFALLRILNNAKSLATDILAWRYYVIAPLTEEVVFRACMIPLLLCAGLKHALVIIFCPLFFGLAHLNRFWELVHQQKVGKHNASLIVGLQLGYTTVFGWYAAFLYLRTGHLVAPLVAHIFCNMMGLPTVENAVRQRGMAVIFVLGFAAFFFMLGPVTDPRLYNNSSGSCECWHGCCKWR